MKKINLNFVNILCVNNSYVTKSDLSKNINIENIFYVLKLVLDVKSIATFFLTEIIIEQLKMTQNM